MTTKDNILQKIRSNRAHLSDMGISSIGVFGSYARDEQKPGSDIDILVDFQPGSEKFDTLMSVCDYLEELFQDEGVEVVTKNGLSPFIGPYILEEVVYA